MLMQTKLGTILSVLFLGGCGVDEAGMSRWVTDNFPTGVESVDCMNIDSDQDGYVSCTVFFDDARPPLAIECAAVATPLKDGCRIATGHGGRR